MMELPDDILDATKFSFAGNFDTQVKEILTWVRLTRTEVENLQHLMDDVQNALSYVWPGCHVYPFGSIVTGLGIKTSDIDCYIQLPHSNPYMNPSRKKFQKGQPVIIARNELRKDYTRFTQLSAITTAKVPIVKFVHIPTGFNCDVNFSSLSGVKNSKLIAFLLSLDPRALHLAILVKYWSKVYNFTGTNLMPNYGLTMMVIFFLQVKSILPSVAELQRYEDCLMVDNWNTAFDDSFIYVTHTEDNLYQLLGSFFNYYRNFDYEHNVISPFLGCSIKKELLTDMHVLPSEYHLYKENVATHTCKIIRLDSSLCIQDPFDHSRNCCIGVFGKLFTKICAHFELAATMFNERPRDDFLRSVLTMNPQVGSQIADNTKPHFKAKNKVHKRNQHQKQARQKAREHFNRWIMESKR